MATNPNGALTFYFNSNYQNNFSGWDATIICEPIPPCSFLPQNLSAYNITTNAAQLNWTDYNNAATSWEVEIVPEGSLPTGVGQISNSNYFGVSNLMSNTIYFYYVRSLCAGLQSAWSFPGTFTTLADYCGGDHFYDNGGQNGNYPSYDYLYKTIFPNNSGDRIRAIFNSFEIESCCDSFTVYDGPSSNYPVIYSGISGIDPTELVATNPNGALTFYFNSNYQNNFSGWDATIICEPIPPCSFAPTNLIVSNTSATGMKLSWTNIELIDTSFEVEIVPVGSIPSGVGTITSTNSMVFSNLASGSCYNILVRAICPSAYSAWSMISNVCTTPDYCAGSHFFDSGGATGNYQDYENYTTIIYPSSPTNKVRAIFNSFQTESSYDYMRIYNGDSSNSPLLFNGSGNTSPGTKTSTAVSGALTFVFTSDGSATYSGWDATINCSYLGTSNPEQNFKTLEYYPNPVQNLFFIKASENITKYSVFSIDGKLIKESNIGQKEFSIDMSQIEIGTYLVKIENENNESRTIKVLRK